MQLCYVFVIFTIIFCSDSEDYRHDVVTAHVEPSPITFERVIIKSDSNSYASAEDSEQQESCSDSTCVLRHSNVTAQHRDAFFQSVLTGSAKSADGDEHVFKTDVDKNATTSNDGEEAASNPTTSNISDPQVEDFKPEFKENPEEKSEPEVLLLDFDQKHDYHEEPEYETVPGTRQNQNETPIIFAKSPLTMPVDSECKLDLSNLNCYQILLCSKENPLITRIINPEFLNQKETTEVNELTFIEQYDNLRVNEQVGEDKREGNFEVYLPVGTKRVMILLGKDVPVFRINNLGKDWQVSTFKTELFDFEYKVNKKVKVENDNNFGEVIIKEEIEREQEVDDKKEEMVNDKKEEEVDDKNDEKVDTKDDDKVEMKDEKNNQDDNNGEKKVKRKNSFFGRKKIKNDKDYCEQKEITKPGERCDEPTTYKLEADEKKKKAKEAAQRKEEENRRKKEEKKAKKDEEKAKKEEAKRKKSEEKEKKKAEELALKAAKREKKGSLVSLTSHSRKGSNASSIFGTMRNKDKEMEEANLTLVSVKKREETYKKLDEDGNVAGSSKEVSKVASKDD